MGEEVMETVEIRRSLKKYWWFLYPLVLVLGMETVVTIVAVLTQKTVYVRITGTGNIIGNASVQPLQPVGINAVSTVQISASLVVVATAVAGLLKWLSWRAKHGKNRTPVVLIPHSRKSK